MSEWFVGIGYEGQLATWLVASFPFIHSCFTACLAIPLVFCRRTSLPAEALADDVSSGIDDGKRQWR